MDDHSLLSSMEEGLYSLDRMCSVPDLPKDAFARARALLLQDAVSSCIHFSRLSSCQNGQQKRILSLIRRADVRCRLTLSCLTMQTPPEEEILLHSFLSMETAAALSGLLPDNAVRRALDGVLPECQDEVYRLANCLPFSRDPGAVLGGFAEIMPGRPLIACHRHPFDGLAESGDQPADDLSRAAVCVMEAVARGLYEMHAAARAEDPLLRALHRECALIREEHISLFSSLRPAEAPLQTLYQNESVLAWLLSSCARAEESAALRHLYAREEAHARTHTRALLSLMGTEESAGDAPLLILAPCKNAVRDAVCQAGLTAVGNKWIPVGSLPRDADFFRYQRRVLPPDPQVPSHAVILRRIMATGADCRFEIAPHPIPALRNRQEDDTRLGR